MEWDGGSCDILTDFRVWIQFGEYLKERKIYLGIFEGFRAPVGDVWQRAAIEFYRCKNIVPRATRPPSNVRGFDMMVDAPYIVAAFQQAYGIDLTSCDMHWHRFMALFYGLPDSTKFSNIMGYRNWNPADEKLKHADLMREQQKAWALPVEEVDDGYGGIGALLASIGEI